MRAVYRTIVVSLLHVWRTNSWCLQEVCVHRTGTIPNVQFRLECVRMNAYTRNLILWISVLSTHDSSSGTNEKKNALHERLTATTTIIINVSQCLLANIPWARANVGIYYLQGIFSRMHNSRAPNIGMDTLYSFFVLLKQIYSSPSRSCLHG